MTTTEEVKLLLDKVNLLFNVFAKEDIAKISVLEKQVLKEQIQNLLNKVEELGFESDEEEELEVNLNFAKAPQLEADATEVEKIEEKLREPETNLVADDEAIQVPVAEVKVTYNSPKPTRTMQQIIDLNKSFIFRSELFKGDNEAYLAFVAKLNTIEEEEASLAFVKKTVEERNWDMEDKVVELMFKAVEKRFAPLLQN